MQKKLMQAAVTTGVVVVNVYGIYALARDVGRKLASRGKTTS